MPDIYVKEAADHFGKDHGRTRAIRGKNGPHQVVIATQCAKGWMDLSAGDLDSTSGRKLRCLFFELSEVMALAAFTQICDIAL